MNNAVDTSNSDSSLVASDGSGLYYALLYAEHAVSTRALETLQFVQTLSHTLNDVTEGQVAEKKIHWWHEELARLAKQQARHPDAIGVQTYLHSNDSIAASLAILSATATEHFASFETEQALNDSLVSDYSARLALLNAAMDTNSRLTTQTGVQHGDTPIKFHAKSELSDENKSPLISRKIELIALGLGQFDRLNSLPKRLRCGYPVFSNERYEKHGLTPDDLLSHAGQLSEQKANSHNAVRALLTSAVADAHLCIEKAVDCISELHTSEPTNLSVNILCQIRRAQLTLWNKRKPNLLTESITLTPIRKFFIAYRCKRRFEHN